MRGCTTRRTCIRSGSNASPVTRYGSPARRVGASGETSRSARRSSSSFRPGITRRLGAPPERGAGQRCLGLLLGAARPGPHALHHQQLGWCGRYPPLRRHPLPDGAEDDAWIAGSRRVGDRLTAAVRRERASVWVRANRCAGRSVRLNTSDVDGVPESATLPIQPSGHGDESRTAGFVRDALPLISSTRAVSPDPARCVPRRSQARAQTSTRPTSRDRDCRGIE